MFLYYKKEHEKSIVQGTGILNQQLHILLWSMQS